MSFEWTCPAPLRDYERITIGHGGGGLLTEDLIRHLFLPGFGPAAAAASPDDAAIIDVGGQRIAFSTDSYVVRPLFFPGGDIGRLAVHGTVNDLAMVGAAPLALSTAFVLEEGVELEVVARVAASMGAAAAEAGVMLITGDTKVVDAGLADGMYITTAGVGLVPPGLEIGPRQARSGDVVIVSGPIGQHGTAVLSVREGLEFGTEIESECAPLNGLVASMLATGADVRVLRDLARGGPAAALCEIAQEAAVEINVDEMSIPVPPAVDAACGFLGLDPIHVANEGTLVAVVHPDDAERILIAMKAHERGVRAAVIGEVSADRPGTVSARTALGSHRLITRPLVEQLPRIC